MGLGLATGALSAQEIGGEAYPTTVTGPQCEDVQREQLEQMVIVGGTVSGASLQWVDDAELAMPDAPELPEIDASMWLPPPDDAQ
jgi:hypothetical protein